MRADVLPDEEVPQPLGTTSGVASRHVTWRAWYAVTVLMLAYFLSLVDRIILTLLVEPIQHDLHISDTEFSLLTGMAFGVCYAIAAIPLAHLADRRSRRAIIALGVAGWSVMTALCGQARNFGQLFLARVGVGIGEAALSPAAVSLLTQMFPREHLGKALAIFSIGGALGSGFGYLLGGVVVSAIAAVDIGSLPLVGHMASWQLVFLIVALPGVVVTALVMTIDEPVRTIPPTRRGEGSAMTAHLRQTAVPYGVYIAGFTCFNIVYYGFSGWLPAFMIRTHGVDTPTAGIALGSAMLLGGPAGMFAGGWLADIMMAKGQRNAPMMVGAGGSIGLGVSALFLCTTQNWYLMLAALTLFHCFGSVVAGIGNLGVQLLTPDHLRARATAIFFLIISLVGIGIGPLLVALLTDHLFQDALAIGRSLLIIGTLFPVLAFLLFKGGSAAYAQGARY